MSKRKLTTYLMAGVLAAGAVVGVSIVSAQEAGRATFKAKVTKVGEKPDAKAEPEAQGAEVKRDERAPGWTTAVTPKPLSKSLKRGLDWLAGTQNRDGGWGQGDESVNMRGSRNGEVRSNSNVADTSMATLALIRSGSSPSDGAYRGTVRKGVEYVVGQIEASDEDSLYVTDVRGTRVQSKIGTYVDTFTSLMLLSEVKGTMGTAGENKRVEKAMSKVVTKIEKNQRQDGTFANQGWAPVLTQGLAAKGLNRASQSGADVDDRTLRRLESAAQAQASAAPGAGDAGIALYSKAAGSSGLRDTVNTWKGKRKDLEKKAAHGNALERRAARRDIARNEKAAKAADSAEADLVGRLADPSFVQGFGNNGGEEYLSYLLVSESLVVQGGERWKKWDANMANLLARVQNKDGSWTGHHCITGRTFCTASALLVLMADRAPVPVSASLRKG
jgi:hypothetical protein